MSGRPLLPTALTGLALLAGCQEKQAEAPPVRPVLSVVVAPLATRTLGFTGTVEPRYKTDLGFRILGRMLSRSVEVGDFVKAGEQLATIDAVALELAVRASTAEVSTARAQLANATGIEGRQRVLAERNVSTQAQLEGAQQGQDSAVAALRRADANLAKAKEQLGHARLRAETDGVVTAIGAQAGQVVQPGQAVVTVARPDVRDAAVDVPEDVARDLRPGTAFEVALQLDPSVRQSGKVREIGPQADQTTRTRRIRIALEAATDVFRLGTTVTATLSTPTAVGVDLPATALLDRGDKTLVWVVDPGTATVSTREVKVTERRGSSVRVTDGVADGMRVVVAGVESLEPGQRVKLTEEPVR